MHRHGRAVEALRVFRLLEDVAAGIREVAEY